MKVIETVELTKSYGEAHALNHLSMAVEENKITGLIGRNGAGKTTLLRLIAGHLKVTSGEIRVFSQRPFNNLAVAAKTILVDDTMAFPPAFTLKDILQEIALFYPNWDTGLAQGLFDYFNLNPRQRHHNLSKGGKSTFNCIIGLASRAPLTLFDEPTTGMDSAVRKDFYRALLKDYLNIPRTVILSSHLLSEVEEIMEDIILIKKGTCRLHLPVLEMKEYALGLRGMKENVLSLIRGKECFYQEEFAKDQLYAVVERKELEDRLELVPKLGIEISGIELDDLCNYLTVNSQGGISDVFTRE